MKPSKHFKVWKYSNIQYSYHFLKFFFNFFTLLPVFQLFMSMHVILVSLTFSRVCTSLHLTVLVMFFFSKQLIPMNGYCHFNYGKVNILMQLWAA